MKQEKEKKKAEENLEVETEETVQETAPEEQQATAETENAEEEVILTPLEEALKAADEFKDRWYRVSAEFDNYKKRMSVAEGNAYRNGKADVILKILPIGDNLSRALAMPLDDKNKEGIEMLLKSFNEVLKSLDVSEINPEGEKFDPVYSEAVMQAEGEEGEESGDVKTVFEKGYKLGNKVIRYAKVSVVK